MATYSREHFEQIAAAIHKDVADLYQHENSFEAAAMWYRRNVGLIKNCRPSKSRRPAPSVMHTRMTRIANAARKLLRHLGVKDPAQAPDGPEIAVLQVLASTDDRTEDAVLQATARIGRLVEIVEAIDAARKLERCAQLGAEDVVRMGRLVIPKGHRGEAAENDWIADMMSIYKRVTGKDPGISVVSPGRTNRGKATGPLIRFIQAAGKPLGIQFSPDSLAGRIRAIRTGGGTQQK